MSPAVLRRNIYTPGPQMDPAEIERRVNELLASQEYGILATTDSGQPRAMAMDYVNEGLTLFMITEPSRKLDHILKNPRVGFCVFVAGEIPDGVKQVEMEGTAEVLESPFVNKTSNVYNKPWKERMESLRHVENLNLKTTKLVRVQIDTVTLLDGSLTAQGFGTLQFLKKKRLASAFDRSSSNQ
jgi:nitroimidazol reductase NimA-like FMN-containing flavoprotein (pyridoxamine 5'-phosphate oxidase superfamily)